MRFDVTASGMAALMHDIEGDIAGAATGAMRESTPDAKQRLREQVTAAGLGNRLANTWRGESYPKGRASVNPAGFIWSNAPDIIDSFNRGAQIVPHAGRKFLAIPTRNVPRSRGRGTRKAMSFEQVEHEFNQDMFFKRGRAAASSRSSMRSTGAATAGCAPPPRGGSRRAARSSPC